MFLGTHSPGRGGLGGRGRVLEERKGGHGGWSVVNAG